MRLILLVTASSYLWCAQFRQPSDKQITIHQHGFGIPLKARLSFLVPGQLQAVQVFPNRFSFGMAIDKIKIMKDP